MRERPRSPRLWALHADRMRHGRDGRHAHAAPPGPPGAGGWARCPLSRGWVSESISRVPRRPHLFFNLTSKSGDNGERTSTRLKSCRQVESVKRAGIVHTDYVSWRKQKHHTRRRATPRKIRQERSGRAGKEATERGLGGREKALLSSLHLEHILVLDALPLEIGLWSAVINRTSRAGGLRSTPALSLSLRTKKISNDIGKISVYSESEIVFHITRISE